MTIPPAPGVPPITPGTPGLSCETRHETLTFTLVSVVSA